jgi:hypothetical protein
MPVSPYTPMSAVERRQKSAIFGPDIISAVSMFSLMHSSRRTALLEFGAAETREIRIFGSESQSMPKYRASCSHYRVIPINRSPVVSGSLHWRGFLSRLCTRVRALAVHVWLGISVLYVWPVLDL